MNQGKKLKRIKSLTWLFIIGLFIGVATAIPLRAELDLVAKLLGEPICCTKRRAPDFTRWILKRCGITTRKESYEPYKMDQSFHPQPP